MKKLVIVFTTSHADTIGNENRLNMMEYAASRFQAVILTNQPSFLKNRYPDLDICNIDMPVKKGYLFRKLSYCRALAGHINSLDADAVLLIPYDTGTAIWTRKPTFQYIHQYGRRSAAASLKSRFKKALTDSVYRYFTVKGFMNAKLNFTVSKILIDQFGKRGVKNMVFMPHAIKTIRFQSPVFSEVHQKLKEKNEQGYFILVYSGWVAENRGLQLMLDTIKILRDADPRFLLVILGADHNYSKRITSYSNEHNLSENIMNLGLLDSSCIPGILGLAHVGLNFWDDNVPGFNLSPPQKIFEYMAAGLPVICNDMPMHNTYIHNLNTGMLTAMVSLSVADAILKLKNEPALYQGMSDKARQESLKYDIEKVYGEMVKLIHQHV